MNNVPDYIFNQFEGIVKSILIDSYHNIDHCVQVGSCDGKINDFYRPIQKLTNIPTTLVEPLTKRFIQLQSSYADHNNCTFVNAAIDTNNTPRTLLYPIDSNIPFGSFYLEHAKIIQTPIIESTVDCILWKDVLHEDTKMVIMDTDGHEYTLLFDLLENYQHLPDIIIWESFRDIKNITKLLTNHGYYTNHYMNDSISILKSTKIFT